MTFDTVDRRDGEHAFGRIAPHRLLGKLHDAVWERRLRARTGRGGRDDPAGAEVRRAPPPYRACFAMLDHVRPGDGDVVVDLACGDGRFVVCAATLAVRKVVGIDNDSGLAARARANVAQMRRRQAPVNLVTALAQDVDISHGSIFYLFDALDPGSLRAILRNARPAAESGRAVRFIYASPQQDWVLQDSGWLQRQDHWPAGRDGNPYPISFWRLPAAR